LTAAEKMKEYRTSHGYSVKRLSERCEISTTLLKMIENGMVTHPNIAKRVAKVYGLTDEETYELMPEIHRLNSPMYDPDKYKMPEDLYKRRPMADKPKKDVIVDAYLAEKKRRKWYEEA